MQNCVTEMDFRLSFLRLMEKIVVMTEEVEVYIERSKRELLMDIDVDFDYRDMAIKLSDLSIDSNKTLRLQLSERNAPLLKDEAVMNKDYLKTAVNRFVPDDDDKYMEVFNDENYIDALNKVGVNNLIPINNTSLFLKKALNGLCDKMFELSRILERGNHSLYENLYDKTFSSLKLSALTYALREKFEEWRENHDALEGDTKWKQKIKEHIQDCMIELFNTGFLDYYELSMTEDDKAICSENLKKLNKLGDDHLPSYLRLCEIMDMSFNKKDEFNYKPNKKKIGRYIYKQRRNRNFVKIADFFLFLIRLQLHKEALEEKKITQQLDYNAPTVVFKNFLTNNNWIGTVMTEGYNTNYLENFVDALMKSEHKDYIASKWCNKRGREKMKCHLLGTLSRAGVLIENASKIARKYTGKEITDNKTSNFRDYITEGKNNKKCAYSDWVTDYVSGKV